MSKDLASPVLKKTILRGAEVVYEIEGGLTKREMFAMAAMQGMIASNCRNINGTHWASRSDICASDAVIFADDLLAALEK